MNIIKTAGLIGLGYMLRDTNVLKGRYYGSQLTFGEYFHEVAINKLDIIFYGRERHSKEPKLIPYNVGDRYQNYFVDYRQHTRDQQVNLARQLCKFDSKEKAEAALDDLENFIKDYAVASVADWHDIYYNYMLTEEHKKLKTCYTDSKYGWRDLSTARIVKNYGSTYEVQLPGIEPLD